MSKRMAAIFGVAFGVLVVAIVVASLILFLPPRQAASTPPPTFVQLASPTLTPMPTVTPSQPVGDQPTAPPSGGVGGDEVPIGQSPAP